MQDERISRLAFFAGAQNRAGRRLVYPARRPARYSLARRTGCPALIAVTLVLALACLSSGCHREYAGVNASTSVLDIFGHPVDPLQNISGEAVVFLFLSTECPVSNRYAPEIERLRARFSPRGAVFWLVYPNVDETAEAIQRHVNEYHLTAASLRDPSHVLVERAQASVTPEAAVFDKTARLVYHGRIDDRCVVLGQERPEATRHDLEEAIQSVLEGRPVKVSATRAIGCSIPAKQ